jgi:hypothetical protein
MVVRLEQSGGKSLVAKSLKSLITQIARKLSSIRGDYVNLRKVDLSNFLERKPAQGF